MHTLQQTVAKSFRRTAEEKEKTKKCVKWRLAMIRQEAHKDKLISRFYRNEECEILVDRQQRD